MRHSGNSFDSGLRLAVLTLAACSLLLFYPSVVQSAAPGPFWTKLTPFEQQTLGNLAKARKGDADTLLALALMASGDVRRQSDYDAMRQRVRRFIDNLRPKMDRQTTVYAKGDTLLRAMHRHFFPKSTADGDSDLVGGYDDQQSRVSAILQNGRFNCISSAIFYTVLARYFDLQVSGVLMAHHAFVQISDPTGRRIEVETTSRRGYGMAHDKAFFQSGMGTFSRDRGLAMPTYADYRKRRLVTPVLLIAQNMNTQHTAPARMDRATRYRLFEIRGYLDPEGTAAQMSRLTALYNEMASLINSSRHRRAMALTRVLGPVLDHVAGRTWIRGQQSPDVAAIWKRMAAIHTMWGHLLYQQSQYRLAEGRFTEALSWARTETQKSNARKGLYSSMGQRALDGGRWKAAIDAYEKLRSQTDPSDRQQSRHARESLAAAYFNWANAAAAQHRWLDAVRRYDAVEQNSQNKTTLRKARAARAFAHARFQLEKRHWPKAIEYFETARSLQAPGQQAISAHNIGSAYLFWANDLLEGGKHRLAVEKYAAALEWVAKDHEAAIYNNIALAYHRQAQALIKAGKRADAESLWQSAARRFPNCIPCQVHHRR